MTGISILAICLKYPFSYLSKKISTKRKRKRFSGKDNLIFKELLHFNMADFQNHMGYFHANKLASYFEKILKKTHPEYCHWSLTKSWDRFKHLKTYQDDMEHISQMASIPVDKLVYINWASSSNGHMNVWIHPSIAVAFTTWLHPLYGSILAEQTDVKYDECYEETYYDALHNFMEEIKDTNRHMDELLKGT
jgi:hypothetical protein